jgi:hypothetical protein
MPRSKVALSLRERSHRASQARRLTTFDDAGRPRQPSIHLAERDEHFAGAPLAPSTPFTAVGQSITRPASTISIHLRAGSSKDMSRWHNHRTLAHPTAFPPRAPPGREKRTHLHSPTSPLLATLRVATFRGERHPSSLGFRFASPQANFFRASGSGIRQGRRHRPPAPKARSIPAWANGPGECRKNQMKG